MLKRILPTAIVSYAMLFILLSAFSIEPQASYAKHFYVNSTIILTDTPIVICKNDSVSVETTIQLNVSAIQYTNRFIKKNAAELDLIRKKSASFFKIMESVFKQYELPVELKYLAVVESHLKTHVVSRAGAKGLWQLMPATAKALGLKITGKKDERTQCYKSTVAAAKHLKNLYAMFNDWLLTIAAYNSGPGTVYRAIKKSGSRDFWKLQHYLPAETRGHVKRFIAIHCYFQEAYSMTLFTKAE